MQLSCHICGNTDHRAINGECPMIGSKEHIKAYGGDVFPLSSGNPTAGEPVSAAVYECEPLSIYDPPKPGPGIPLHERAALDFSDPPAIGWRCPVCGLGNAPHADKCGHCAKAT